MVLLICMSRMYRGIKHFVVTWENGKILVSRAREVIPNRTYEIVHTPPPLECPWKHLQSSILKVDGIGLGETTKIKSSLS
jgi:hypothetical protein